MKAKHYKGNFNSTLTDLLMLSNGRGKRGPDLVLLNPDMYKDGFMDTIFCLDKFIHLKLGNLGTKQDLVKCNFLCIGLLDFTFSHSSPNPYFGVNFKQGKLATL